MDIPGKSCLNMQNVSHTVYTGRWSCCISVYQIQFNNVISICV